MNSIHCTPDSTPRAFAVDGHQDIAWHMLYYNRGFSEKENPKGAMITLESLWEGGVLISIASIFVEHDKSRDERRTIFERQLDIYDNLTSYPGVVKLTSPSAISKTREKFEGEEKVWGFILQLEGADLLGSPDELDSLYERGLRIASLTWNEGNQWAGGARSSTGLTDRGKQFLAKLKELGIILDVSHLNERSFWEVLDTWEGPVIASHSNAFAICPHPRNLKDDQIREISLRGGIVGTLLYNGLISPNWEEGHKRLPLDALVSHIIHMLGIASEYSVAIGSDFDGGITREDTPQGMNKISDLWLIAEELDKKGVKADVVRRVMGLNWFNFLLKNLGSPKPS